METLEHCPICGGDGSLIIQDKSDLVIYRCCDCDVAYQNPRLDREELDNYYRSGEYHRNYPPVDEREMARSDRYITMIRLLELKTNRCLDYGCARGYLLRNLQIYNSSHVLGFEISPIEHVLEEVVDDKSRVCGTFDLITCIHVLEHLYNPEEELRWMTERLNPDGTLILELPLRDDDVSYPHLYNFSKKSITYLLDKMGLKYVYMKSGNRSMILIGAGYDAYKVEEVVEEFDFYNSFSEIYR